MRVVAREEGSSADLSDANRQLTLHAARPGRWRSVISQA